MKLAQSPLAGVLSTLAAPLSPLTDLVRQLQKMAQQESWLFVLLVFLQIIANLGVIYFFWQSMRKIIKIVCTGIMRLHHRKMTPSQIANAGKNMGHPQTKKIKVLMLAESAPPQINGIARRVGHYVESLAELKHDVVEYSPRTEENAIPFPNLWQLGNKMMVIPPSAYQRAMLEDWDVVHCVCPLNLSTFFFFQGLLFKSFFTGKRPVLVSSWHCNIGDYLPRFMPSKTPKWFNDALVYTMMWCSKAMLNMSDRLLLPTLATEPALTCLMPDVPLGLCPTGVNDKEFSGKWKDTPEGREWEALKKKDLKENKCEKILLYVGRFSPEKSLDKLMIALERLNKDAEPGHRCMLWLVGHGPLEVVIRRVAEEKQLPVRFCGFQTGSKLSAAYTAGDVFVSASLTETFGQTVSEALASGLNVAIPRTDCFDAAFGQFPEVVKLWKMDDDEDMVRAIKDACFHAEVQGKKDPLPNWKKATELLVDQYREAAVSRAKKNSTPEKFVASLPWMIFYFLAEVLLWLITMLENQISRGDQHKNRRGMKAANCLIALISMFILFNTGVMLWHLGNWLLTPGFQEQHPTNFLHAFYSAMADKNKRKATPELSRKEKAARPCPRSWIHAPPSPTKLTTRAWRACSNVPTFPKRHGGWQSQSKAYLSCGSRFECTAR
eukprot:g50795.t1